MSSWVRRPGAQGSARSRSDWSCVTIPGHTAVATICPHNGRVPELSDAFGVCLRRPEMRADASGRRSVVGRHVPPVGVVTPRSARSTVTRSAR